MVATLPTSWPRNVGWVIEDYDELSSDPSIFVEVETFREEERHFDPRAPITYGPPRTIIRRHSFDSLVDEIELDGPPIYQLEQRPQYDVTLLIGSVGGKPWIIARLPGPAGRTHTNTNPSRSKDMTEYTDEELAHAIHVAAYDRMGSIGINHDTSEAQGEIHPTVLNDLREILEHLPAKGEPAEEWEPCTFSDIRKGDRVKRVYPLIGDGTETIEGTAVTVDENWALTKGGTTLAHSRDINKPGITLHRIPAPVTHPDPEQHEVIFVFETEARDYMFSGGRQLVIWDGCNYVNSESMIKPDHIIDWSPAKITPLED